MKQTKKMSIGRTVKLKKLSARVPNLVYMKAKFIADCQSMTMEEKLTDLLKKDIVYVSSQKWFQEMIQEQEEGSQDFVLFGSSQSKKKQNNKNDFNSIGFEDNQIMDGDDKNE